jgi:hypothetical protein
MISIWATGPPTPKAARQFAADKHRRAIHGREYMRQTEVRKGQDKLLENLVIMLEHEGWEDVVVLEGPDRTQGEKECPPPQPPPPRPHSARRDLLKCSFCNKKAVKVITKITGLERNATYCQVCEKHYNEKKDLFTDDYRIQDICSTVSDAAIRAATDNDKDSIFQSSEFLARFGVYCQRRRKNGTFNKKEYQREYMKEYRKRIKAERGA